MPRKRLKKFACSRKALAVPVTYLILFGSLMVLVSITYSFAVAQISSKGAMLKVVAAKQNMQALDDAIRLVAWSPGASKTVYMEDCGGVFQTQPNAKNLVLRLTDGGSFSSVVFNGSVGKAFYTFEALPESQEGLFVRGDGRAIVGQNAYTLTQLYFAIGEGSQQLVLCYRPIATALAAGLSNGKPLNILRVHVISLNSAQQLTLGGGFNLKVSAINVTSTVQSFIFESAVSSFALEALSENVKTTVWLPIESTAEGAVVSLESIVSNINIQVVNP